MAGTGQVGSIGEFVPEVENVAAYLERLQLYITANSISEEKTVSVLLTVVGPKVYSLLRSLVAPALPQEKSFEELVECLKEHFSPKPIVIAERFRFYRRSQRGHETVAEFVADLRRLAINCEFGAFLDKAL